MMNTGIILTLGYPETIVLHAEEWYSSYLKYLGVGSRTHVRAGHAALVLIHKETGELEYHDFGRYITPEPSGRVRGKEMDCELEFPIKAVIKNNTIVNLNEILYFLATNPKLTHGEGTLYASVCDEIDYQAAKDYITNMQDKYFIRYAAFLKEASNCARFINETIIASVTNSRIKKQLIQSQWFTPSTVGNVVIADSQNSIYEVCPNGKISDFSKSVSKINRACFLDRLKGHQPILEGTLLPKHNQGINGSAQWLSGIAAGAWFEIYPTAVSSEYTFKRIAANGRIDVEGIYVPLESDFTLNETYEFVHYSNCLFFHLKQNNKIYRFNIKDRLV